MEFPQNLKLELPYDSAIPLLGIYLDKTIIQTDTSTPMYIAVLFTTAKTWKQPKVFFFADKRIKMWGIYTVKYYSTIKKNEISTFATIWMDLEIIILSEISQEEKYKYHMISLTCGI